MKQLYRSYWTRFCFLVGAIVALVLTAYCHLPSSKHPPAHLAMVKQAGETLSIDSLDNKVLLGKDNPSIPTTLRCFLITWADDLDNGDELGMICRDSYFQYRMQQDWVALVGGDSIRPVLFRNKPLLNRHLRQGAIAFSIPTGCRVDKIGRAH